MNQFALIGKALAAQNRRTVVPPNPSGECLPPVLSGAFVAERDEGFVVNEAAGGLVGQARHCAADECADVDRFGLGHSR